MKKTGLWQRSKSAPDAILGVSNSVTGILVGDSQKALLPVPPKSGNNNNHSKFFQRSLDNPDAVLFGRLPDIRITSGTHKHTD